MPGRAWQGQVHDLSRSPHCPSNGPSGRAPPALQQHKSMGPARVIGMGDSQGRLAPSDGSRRARARNERLSWECDLFPGSQDAPGPGPGRAMQRSRPVSRVLLKAIIPLGRMSPCVSSDLPESDAGHIMGLCLVLLQVGFAMPRLLPAARCALTAPFHPYPPPHGAAGGIFSVALSVGSRPPGVTWHPALRSPDFPPRK